VVVIRLTLTKFLITTIFSGLNELGEVKVWTKEELDGKQSVS
jgi:hypothetical protein